MSDLELIRRYEPIARFTEGEMFFPMAVDEYVKSCSLWITDSTGIEQLIVPEGELDLGLLASYGRVPHGHTVHLRFVAEPMAGIRYRVWLARKKVKFRASGRMARVPLLSRLVDSLLNLSLAVRGKVPGGTAAAADLRYRRVRRLDPRRAYYGRVVRQAGWVVLHYLFFYPMNNWRSGFSGVNDHEADWEQMFVYLYESESGVLEPRWVAYASHEFTGDDLRRRWDDPMIVKEGSHPVVFVGAGSHSGYFEQGEYLMGAAPQFLTPLRDALSSARRYWVRGLGMVEAPVADQFSVLQVPFVDYARGDGLSIGPGQQEEWSPVMIEGEEPWAHGYRGLWGLDTQDPIEGERAPAGPKYNRDGSIRLSWLRPLAWAGLDKQYPPSDVPKQIQQRVSAITHEIQDLNHLSQKRRAELRTLALEVRALEADGKFGALYDKKMRKLVSREGDLQQLQVQKSGLAEVKDALETYLKRVEGGERRPPEAHLRRSHHPEPSVGKRSRIIETWAAVSAALILLGILALLLVRPPNWPILALGFAFGIGAIEAVTRRWFIRYLMQLTLVLAIISALVLLVEFWQAALMLAIGGLALFILRENLRELASN
ncbi:MAG: hypothetical protein ACE5M4_02385 [Anaerolineales bacterium]